MHEIDQNYGLFNYTDTPDLTMNELVSKVRERLNGTHGVGFRLPYLVGIIFGYLGDIFSRLSGKKISISSVRIKKFTSPTEFKSAKFNVDGFKPPFQLTQGLERTLQSEFITPDPNREIFFTE